MPLSRNALLASGFLLVLIAIGAADALLTRNTMALPDDSAEEGPTVEQVDVTRTVPTGEEVTKQNGPDVLGVLATLGIEKESTDTESILRRVLPEKSPVTTVILLKENDRIGLLSFAESPLVKTYFLALKEALHTSFSSEMTDLVDETHKRKGKAVRNFLTFRDPAIDSERLVFIRIRDRLYEFHIADGKDDAVFLLVEALTD